MMCTLAYSILSYIAYLCHKIFVKCLYHKHIHSFYLQARLKHIALLYSIKTQYKIYDILMSSGSLCARAWIVFGTLGVNRMVMHVRIFLSRCCSFPFCRGCRLDIHSSTLRLLRAPANLYLYLYSFASSALFYIPSFCSAHFAHSTPLLLTTRIISARVLALHKNIRRCFERAKLRRISIRESFIVLQNEFVFMILKSPNMLGIWYSSWNGKYSRY